MLLVQAGCNVAAPERGGKPPLGGGGIPVKSFTFVLNFTEEIPPSALAGSHLPFQGRLLWETIFVQLLGLPYQNRPAKFARCSRCPPRACQRRWLPLPVAVM